MPNFDQSLKQIIKRSGGEVFWRKFTVTSSSVSNTKLAITQAATGDVAVVQMIVKTDGTGLAGGTNFVVGSTNAKGLSNIFVETVANLGANKTKVLSPGTTDTDETTSSSTPSVTGVMTVIEAGQNLWVNCTGSACTGAGTMDIYVKFERVFDNADIVGGSH